MMFMNLSNIAIPDLYDVDYHCIINGTDKNEAINLLQKSIWLMKREHYKAKNFIIYIKIAIAIILHDIEIGKT